MAHDYFLQLMKARVAPVDRPWEQGIDLANGSTRPFVVERAWSGPAGTYIEEWSIRRDGKVLYRRPSDYIRVRGTQSVSAYSESVTDPIALESGAYDLVFVVEGYLMGSAGIEVLAPQERQARAEAAEAAPVEAPPARAPRPAPAGPAVKPAAPSPRLSAPVAPAVAVGEDPAEVRKRVYDEELAKGSDPRVAQARAKSAEIRARKAAAAPPREAPPAPAKPVEPERAPAPAAPRGRPEAATDGAGEAIPGGMSPEEAAQVRRLIYEEAIAKGKDPKVAEALAVAAETRAVRGPWWRPDW